jgi:leucine dehydrogenase
VVNAGGVIWLAGYETLGWDDAQVQAHLVGIAATLEQVFRDAETNGVTTAEAADRLARDRIAAAPPR